MFSRTSTGKLISLSIYIFAFVVPSVIAQDDLGDDGYAYEYKSGPGQYNYDVEGYDSDGKYVYGNVDTQDRYVDGYITDENGDQVYFSGEWTGYGVIEGSDENGDWIQLEPE